MKPEIVGWMIAHKTGEPEPVLENATLIQDTMSPRFKSEAEARAKVAEFMAWDRKSNFSLLDGSVPPYVQEESAIGKKTFVNPEWIAASWTILVYARP